MGLVLALVSLVLLVLQILLVARMVLDWSLVLAGTPAPGSLRQRLLAGVVAATEPILAPVRRVVPPLRLGGVGIDLSFILVFLTITIVRSLI